LFNSLIISSVNFNAIPAPKTPKANPNIESTLLVIYSNSSQFFFQSHFPSHHHNYGFMIVSIKTQFVLQNFFAIVFSFGSKTLVLYLQPQFRFLHFEHTAMKNKERTRI
tara:strand:- start:177 stop:503 length:327 start_codon:yes stop_codon:yes gene_type:complete